VVGHTFGEWNDDDFDVLADGAVVGPPQVKRRNRSGTVVAWCLSATGFDNSAASRTEPPFVRFEAIRNRIVPLILQADDEHVALLKKGVAALGTHGVTRIPTSVRTSPGRTSARLTSARRTSAERISAGRSS
jgi:hypothetical protein